VTNHELWDRVGQQPRPSWYLDLLVAAQKRDAHLHLLGQWLAGSTPRRLLKTDLFEEAFGDDEILAALAAEFPGACYGIDHAHSVVLNAARRHAACGLGIAVMDVRSLAFRDHIETREGFLTRPRSGTGRTRGDHARQPVEPALSSVALAEPRAAGALPAGLHAKPRDARGGPSETWPDGRAPRLAAAQPARGVHGSLSAPAATARPPCGHPHPRPARAVRPARPAAVATADGVLSCDARLQTPGPSLRGTRLSVTRP